MNFRAFLRLFQIKVTHPVVKLFFLLGYSKMWPLLKNRFFIYFGIGCEPTNQASKNDVGE